MNFLSHLFDFLKLKSKVVFFQSQAFSAPPVQPSVAGQKMSQFSDIPREEFCKAFYPKIRLFEVEHANQCAAMAHNDIETAYMIVVNCKE